jgi:hypothetical protein
LLAGKTEREYWATRKNRTNNLADPASSIDFQPERADSAGEEKEKGEQKGQNRPGRQKVKEGGGR